VTGAERNDRGITHHYQTRLIACGNASVEREVNECCATAFCNPTLTRCNYVCSWFYCCRRCSVCLHL